MYRRVLGPTISALMLAYGAVAAIAQDRMTLSQITNKHNPIPWATKGPAQLGREV
jgi:hypothetical protein